MVNLKLPSWYILIILALAAIQSGFAEHWMCSVIDCPIGAEIYRSEMLDNSKGNCFADFEIMAANTGFSGCASICLRKQCAFTASNGNDCVISGLNKGLPALEATFSLQPRSYPIGNFNVALNKLATCSSEQPSASGFILYCDRATDGETTNLNNFYHSEASDANPWMVIDLEKHYSIDKIGYLPRIDNGDGHVRAVGITFYLGSVEVSDGKFQENGYEQIHYYQGPYGDPNIGGNHFLEFNLPSPKCGRFFAIAKEETYTDETKFLEVTEVRVFSVIP